MGDTSESVNPVDTGTRRGGRRERAGRPPLPEEERGEPRRVSMPPGIVEAAEAWGKGNGVRRRSPAIVALAAQGLRVLDRFGGPRAAEVEVEVADDGRRRQGVSLIIAPVISREIEAVALRGGLSFSAAVSALVALALGWEGQAKPAVDSPPAGG